MKFKTIMILLLFSFLIESCAGPGYGAIITASKSAGNYQVNIPQNNDVKMIKKGNSSVVTIFWLFSFGDASISTAMKNGNIDKLHHVDNQVFSFLGLIHIYTIHVYGE